MYSVKTPCVIKVPEEDSLTIEDFYQIILFYSLGFFEFECMNEVASNTTTGNKKIS